MAQRIKALFISDVHLGSRGSQAEELVKVLKAYDPETLYIVGDFIDGWLLKKRHFWPQAHTNVVRKVLSYSKRGTQVIYITGNHDDFLRSYGHLDFGNIHVVDEVIVDGVFITHGDKYDSIVVYNKWVAVLGSMGYEIVLRIDSLVKRVRRSLGLHPRYFSKWVKSSVKHAVAFIDKYEETLVTEAATRDCHTVICGHIHTPDDRKIGGVRYLNTGDFIENCSYITWTEDGLVLHKRDS